MRSDHGAVPREKIQHARRNACFLEHLHEHGAADNRLLGWFHDHGVPGNNSSRRHAAENRDRKVPRRDYEGDATRPVMMIAFFARHLLRKLGASESPHLLGVEGAEVDRFADIAVGFGPWLSDFENFYCREFVAPAFQDIGRAFQQLRPLLERRPSPFFECRARSFNGTLGFLDACFRSVADDLGWLGWINRGSQIIGPNLFPSDVQRMFFAEALSRFAQSTLHFILVVFVNETHKRCVSETMATCCMK